MISLDEKRLEPQRLISLYKKKPVTFSSVTIIYIIEPNRLTTKSGTLLCRRACIIVQLYLYIIVIIP